MERAAREVAAGRIVKRRDVVEGAFGRLDTFLSRNVNAPLLLERTWNAWRIAVLGKSDDVDILCSPADTDKEKQRRASIIGKNRERSLLLLGRNYVAGKNNDECLLCEGLSVSCAMCNVRTRRQTREDKVLVD